MTKSMNKNLKGKQGKGVSRQVKGISKEANNSVIKPWDIIELWTHRLMCGDACNKDHLDQLLEGKQVDMVFTDPPYNINYQRPWRHKILNDHMSTRAYELFLRRVNQNIEKVLKDWWSLYECIGWRNYHIMRKVLEKLFKLKSLIIWNKNYAALGYHYRTKYEMLCYGIKWKKAKIWHGAHNEKDVRDISRVATTKYIHPTEKPIELCKRAILNSSNEKEVILDVFWWSGSTLMAAEQTKRRAYVMELDPGYVELIIRRYKNSADTEDKIIRCVNRKVKMDELLD